MRELLREAAEQLKQCEEGSGTGQSGILGRALAEESLLNQNLRGPTIPDLPEKLVTKSQFEKQMNNQQKAFGVDVLGSGGLGNVFG